MDIERMETTVATEPCPATDDRKVTPKHIQPPTKRIEVDSDGVWHINGYDEARQVLRNEFTRQAGFNAETMVNRTQTVMRNRPILFLEGEEHHRMRRETNKFFTPTVTDKQYRDFMNAFADSLVSEFKRTKRANLHNISNVMSLQVAAQVVGLTDSIMPGLNKRLNAMLSVPSKFIGTTSKWGRIMRLLQTQQNVLSFLMLDVKPAIRARRKQPKSDVISYLLTRDYSDLEILTECLVYGVAGMATTREFICIAIWYLLESPRLRERMMVGSQEERYAILHEILRLEPIVGHLFRRTTGEVEVISEGQTMTIPAGTLVDLSVYAENLDPAVLGEGETAVCPMRPLTSELGKVAEPVMSFGDGAHRCPGAYIAIQETDIFLRKLLAIDTLRIEGTPSVNYSPITNGYEIRNFPIVMD